MKLTLNHNRNRQASFLLLCIVATFVLVVGGVATYHLVKWAKKVNTGERFNRPGFTNDESIVIPPDGGQNYTHYHWENQKFWYEYWDEPGAVAESPVSEPTVTPLLSVPTCPPAEQCVVVYSVLTTNGPIVGIACRNGDGRNDRVTFAELGLEVDAWGMPVNLSQSMGPSPGRGEKWILERSTNMVEWEPVVEQQLLITVTNAHIEFRQPGSVYFRMRR